MVEREKICYVECHERNGYSVFYAYGASGKLLAEAHVGCDVSMWNGAEYERMYYLDSIRTDESCRGMGVGTALLRDILKRCGDKKMALYLAPELEERKDDLYKWYFRMGFRMVDFPESGIEEMVRVPNHREDNDEYSQAVLQSH